MRRLQFAAPRISTQDCHDERSQASASPSTMTFSSSPRSTSASGMGLRLRLRAWRSSRQSSAPAPANALTASPASRYDPSVARRHCSVVMQRLRQHPFTNVVDAMKVLAPGDHQLRQRKQRSMRSLSGFQSHQPLPGYPPSCSKSDGAYRARPSYGNPLAGRDAPSDRSASRSARCATYRQLQGCSIWRRYRRVLNRQKAGSVRPVLNSGRRQQLVEPPPDSPQPAPEHQIGLRHDVDGVDLQHLHGGLRRRQVPAATCRARGAGASRPVAASWSGAGPLQPSDKAGCRWSRC